MSVDICVRNRTLKGKLVQVSVLQEALIKSKEKRQQSIMNDEDELENDFKFERNIISCQNVGMVLPFRTLDQQVSLPIPQFLQPTTVYNAIINIRYYVKLAAGAENNVEMPINVVSVTTEE